MYASLLRVYSDIVRRERGYSAMTTTTHHCDRCRNMITESRSLLRAEAGPAIRKRPEIDLCESCLEALCAWLAAGSKTTEDAR